ncbi:hypothetical protein KKC13_10555 [bacterium]|nr:hypothetical protein [bacterium]MBU1959038.1 hypothetical protein [bacterium]
MGHNAEINRINIIQNALNEYQGFTSGEKKYCIDHLSEWISSDKGLDTMIRKLSEKSLDVRPFLKQIGLLK